VDQDTELAGTASILLYLDESGKVTEVHPNTGDRRLDRELTNVWRDAAFEPYVIGGCRVRAYIHVPLSFSSDHDFTGSRIHVKPVQP
jgi:outer membrane biosynthesis protein TonB